MNIILIYTIRIILVYAFTYLVTRIMTKKAMAQMTAYEVAGIMILANVASEPLVDKVLIKSVYGVGVLVFLMILLSRLSTINKLTAWVEHTATTVIENGQLDMKALKRMSLSLNQLEGLLRQQGYDKLSDIQMAIFEPQGNLSVFPKAENKPVTKKDMGIAQKQTQLTIPLIMDGSILHYNLKHIRKDKAWLLQELSKQGIDDYHHQTALVELDSDLNITIIKK